MNWGYLIGASLETLWDCTVGAFSMVVIDVGAGIANVILHNDYECLYSCY